MSHYLALTCEALARSITASAATSPHTVTVHLIKQGLHDRPKNLRAVLQREIDTVEEQDQPYDAILLVYGLCGTATAGICSRRIPLVIPRAHDCITLYLGSKARYKEEVAAHPGTYWYSVDYMERAEQGSSIALGAATIEFEAQEYEKWIIKWDKETADMLLAEMRQWSQHYTRAAFIDTGLGDFTSYEQIAREKAAQAGWIFERKLGNQRLIDMLANGQWTEQEFLIVPAGHTIQQADGERIIRAEPIS